MTADQEPAETTITSATDGNGLAVNNGTTVSTSMTFTFAGTDNIGVVGFECSLDEAPFIDCTSPVNYSDLILGSHSFQVRATDQAGNVDLTPAEFTWEVLTPAQGAENLNHHS